MVSVKMVNSLFAVLVDVVVIVARSIFHVKPRANGRNIVG